MLGGLYTPTHIVLGLTCNKHATYSKVTGLKLQLIITETKESCT